MRKVAKTAAQPMKKEVAVYMKIFDTLYYAIYRFGRSIGQPHYQAKACAGTFMPAFFYLSGFFFYIVLMHKLGPKLLPPKNFKPIFEAGAVIILIISYIIYVKKGRGERVISKHEKSKNQFSYICLGAAFSIFTVSLPVLMWFVLRAIL